MDFVADRGVDGVMSEKKEEYRRAISIQRTVKVADGYVKVFLTERFDEEPRDHVFEGLKRDLDRFIKEFKPKGPTELPGGEHRHLEDLKYKGVVVGEVLVTASGRKIKIIPSEGLNAGRDHNAVKWLEKIYARIREKHQFSFEILGAERVDGIALEGDFTEEVMKDILSPTAWVLYTASREE